uniref:Uncharacterized LOC113139613 n=1 Tax=Mastacembelus armatus TaxID=205130 RepID=A0A7N8WTT6_9TELE
MNVYPLVLCLALLQQWGRARSDPPGCDSTEAVRFAEEALEQINQDRANGYILSLNRLYDLSHTPEKEKNGSLYKLTIDVMETKCHITSRKPWKQCEVRNIGDIPVGTTWGCIFPLQNQHIEIKLQNYSCALRKVPATSVVRVCPDCPTAENLNDPIIKETVSLSLQRFNEESRLNNYFTLENITRASSQWVFVPAYFVEFTIVETVCPKKTDACELSSCPPMDCQFAVSNILKRVNHFHFYSLKQKNLPRGSLGTVVDQPASPRSAPSAKSCPGPLRDTLGLDEIRTRQAGPPG